MKESGVRIAKLLGQGQFGKVYKIYYGTREFAVKKVKLSMIQTVSNGEPDQEKRIFAQYYFLKTASYQNILKVYSCKQHRGDFYMLMENLQGGDMERYISNTPVTRNQLGNFLAQSALALNHLRRFKYIHKDVSPDNFMVTQINRSENG